MPSIKLGLTEREWEAVEKLAASKGETMTTILRRSIRLYAQVERRLEQGNSLVFVNAAGERTCVVG